MLDGDKSIELGVKDDLAVFVFDLLLQQDEPVRLVDGAQQCSLRETVRFERG